MRSRNYCYSYRRRYSDEDDDDEFQDSDYLSRSSMRKRKSSSPDHPSRHRTEERTRYRSPSRSVKRRRYDDTPRDRYPSCRSIEKTRRRYHCHASRCSVERRRRRSDDARNHRHVSRRSVETRRYTSAQNRYPWSHQTKRRREYVASNQPSVRRSGSDFVKTREEMVSCDVSANFRVGMSRKTSIGSNCLDIGTSPADLVASWVGSFPCCVSDELVVEILSRLPVKSLMRFKSVCKRWLSLIKHDRHFINLHFNNCLKSRKNLLCITGINPHKQQVYDNLPEEEQQVDEEYEEMSSEEDDGISKYKFPQKILCADIVEKSSIRNKVLMTDDKWFDYENVLGLVNGLACFLNWNDDEVRLYNVSTREASPWIKSTLLSVEKEKFDRKIRRDAFYRFGFDPEKKEHKVFCFGRLSYYDKSISDCSPDYTSCEVLAVGRDTKWRRINVVPNENNRIKINKVLPRLEFRKRDPVYANGTIYWRNDVRRCKNDTEHSDDPEVIVALDVGSEKFRVIPIPDQANLYPLYNGLFMLSGRVVIGNWLSERVVKLWMLDDGDDKKLDNCRASERNWISETITLPYAYPVVEFHGFADQLVLSIYSDDCRIYRKFSYLIFYDCWRKTFNKIEIDGLSSVPFFERTSLITSFTESLYPVCSAAT